METRPISDLLGKVSALLTARGVKHNDLRFAAEHLGVITFTAPVADALRSWRVLRGAFTETGLWPVIAIGEGDCFREAWDFPDPEQVREYMEKVDSLDCRSWLNARIDADRAIGWRAHVRGEWSRSPVGVTSHRIQRHFATGELLPMVETLLCPVRSCGGVPAVLGFGGWNENPDPAWHVAVCRHWHFAFGAEIVGVARNVLEMRCQRRPGSRDEAEALAWEHYAYCPDNIDQGSGTVLNYAATLLESDIWRFWWD